MRRFVTIALLFALVGATTYIFAQTKDDNAGTPEKPEVLLAAADEKPDAEEVTKLYTLPEGNDSKILALFLQRIARTPPPVRTEEGIRDHLVRVGAAAEELMSREIEEELFVNAADVRMQIYSLLPQFGDENAPAKRAKLLEQLKKDERELVQQFVSRLVLEERISQIPNLSDEEKDKLIAELTEKLKKATIQEPEEFQMLIQLSAQAAELLEESGDTKRAVAAFTAFAKEMDAKEDPRLERVSEQMLGTARRIDLPGNVMQVSGTTLEGEEYDLAQHKGKVVLVDFWATWCGPCRQELPNVKRLYEAYHEKGFDVVGISLDEDQGQLEEFLKKEQIAWTTLFSADEEKQGWENPIARRYAIASIPTAILVNQEGKVVSMEARGRELANQLEKLLGPIGKKDAPATPDN